VFEPRSNTSRRNIHQEEYAHSFTGADRVAVKVPEPHDQVPVNEQLNVAAVVADLHGQGIAAESSTDVGELVQRVSTEAKSGDVVLVMSNGAFGGFIPSLISELERRFGP
jgi:UDP-N-acetylmuramate: L-alanyl-gamma-D-glutamyl-meso-diaminopimelate ligase